MGRNNLLGRNTVRHLLPHTIYRLTSGLRTQDRPPRRNQRFPYKSLRRNHGYLLLDTPRYRLSTNPSLPESTNLILLRTVLGGTGFMISAVLLMLEVQTKWYRPALGDIGWHSTSSPPLSISCSNTVPPPFSSVRHWPRIVGFWNLVGAEGFMICGAFGYSPLERWVTQSALSTFWGGFSLSHNIQWY